MAPTSVSRRVFLGSVAGGLTLTALNRRVLASQKPNDQIVLGMIGVGGMGTGRLRQFLTHPDVRIGAICDVDRAHIDRAVDSSRRRARTSRKPTATSAASSKIPRSTPSPS